MPGMVHGPGQVGVKRAPLACKVSDAVAPASIKLIFWDVQQPSRGGHNGSWFPSRACQTPYRGETADIVNHLAQDREAIIANVQRAAPCRRIGEDALERELRVGVEVVFEPRYELLEVDSSGASGPRHESLLDKSRGIEGGQKWPEDDVGELVSVTLAVGGRSDEHKMVELVAPPSHSIRPEGEEFQPRSAQRLDEVIGEVVIDRRRRWDGESLRERIHKGGSLLRAGTREGSHWRKHEHDAAYPFVVS